MRRILGSLLALLVCAGAGLAASWGVPCAAVDAQGEDVIVEPETEVAFRVTLRPERGGEQVLAGCGVREKFVFDVYAVGLYVDALAAHERLAAHRGKSGKALADDKAFFSDLASDALPKTLRLVMVRDVDAEDMRAAFEDALLPRITKGRQGDELAVAKAALETFKGLFRKEYVEGTEMVLALRGGGELVATVDGEALGTIASRALCDAVVDVYVGKDPISSDAKKAFGRGMPRVFARGAALAEQAAAEAARRAAERDADEASGDDAAGDDHGAPPQGGASERRSSGDGGGSSAGGRSSAGDPAAASAGDGLAHQRRRVEQATDLLRPRTTAAAHASLAELLDGAALLIGDLRIEQHLDTLHTRVRRGLSGEERALLAEVDDLDLPPCPCEDEHRLRAADDLDAMLAWLADVRGELARRLDTVPRRPALGT